MLRYNAITGAFIDTFVAAGSGGLDFPRAGIFDPVGGDFYVTNPDGYNVVRYDGTTGAFVGTIASGLDGGFNNSGPDGATFGPDGFLYVTEATTGAVRRIAPDGSSSTWFITPHAGGLAQPTSLAFGDDGVLYVASLGTNQILMYDAVTGAFEGVFATSAQGVSQTASIAFRPDAVAASVPAPAALGLLLIGAGMTVAARRRAGRNGRV